MPLRQTFALIACLSAACCVAPSKPPAPAPRPIVTAAPRPIATTAPLPAPAPTSWIDVAQTPGDWSYRRTAEGSVATYADFAIRCARPGTIELARAGQFTADAPMTIRTEFGDRALAGTFGAGDTALRTALMARDPLLDQMAFSKGRFAVEVAGRPSLYLPSWPEVTRVIEDCR